MHRDRAFGRIQVNRPRSPERGLGREIQAERNAEFTLLAVGMFLQIRSAQVRSHINVGWLERFAGYGAELSRNLPMEEPRDRLVVSHVTPRALTVPELDLSGADQIPVVPPQCSYMERVHQVSQRRVSLFSKVRS